MEFAGIVSVAAITVICYLAAALVKATALDNKWLPVICGALGGVLGVVGLYVVIEFGILAWVVMLMIIALKEMNGYTVGKTVLMIGLSLFTMVMIWAVVILLYTISSQFVQMVKEMFYEVVYRID